MDYLYDGNSEYSDSERDHYNLEIEYTDEEYNSRDAEDDTLKIILPLKDVTPSCHIEHKGTFNLLSALESVYPLSDIVCQYLNYADLNNIGTISDLWHKSAEKEKLHRKQPSWSELNLKGFITSSANLKFAEKSQIITFCDLTCNLREYVLVRRDFKCEIKQLIEHLNTDVPKHADAPLTLRKTVITVGKVEPINQKDINVIHLSLYLPDIPNITLRTFWFKSRRDETSQVSESNANQLGKIVGDSKSVECMLLFTLDNENEAASLKNLLQDLLKLQSRVVYGGGIIKSNGINTNDEGSEVVLGSDVFCFAFIKKKNVEANFYSASFVLRPDYNFEERIKTLKETLEIRENTLIFHFYCFDHSTKEEKVTDTEFLKKTFPNAVVVGLNVFFSKGIDSENADYNANQGNFPDCLFNSLVYICWGKLLKSKKTE